MEVAAGALRLLALPLLVASLLRLADIEAARLARAALVAEERSWPARPRQAHWILGRLDWPCQAAALRQTEARKLPELGLVALSLAAGYQAEALLAAQWQPALRQFATTRHSGCKISPPHG